MAPSVPGWDLLAAAIGSNTTNGSIFVPSRDMIVTGLAWAMTTASGSSADVCDVGILDAAATTVLASSGSTAAKLSSTGRQVLSFTAPVLLTGGVTYYAAISFGTVTTAPACLTADFASGFGVEFAGTALGTWWGTRTSSAGPPLASMAGAVRNGGPVALYLVTAGS